MLTNGLLLCDWCFSTALVNHVILLAGHRKWIEVLLFFCPLYSVQPSCYSIKNYTFPSAIKRSSCIFNHYSARQPTVRACLSVCPSHSESKTVKVRVMQSSSQCNSSYGFPVTVRITVSNFYIFQLQLQLIDFSVTITVTDPVIKC